MLLTLYAAVSEHFSREAEEEEDPSQPSADDAAASEEARIALSEALAGLAEPAAAWGEGDA